MMFDQIQAQYIEALAGLAFLSPIMAAIVQMLKSLKFPKRLLPAVGPITGLLLAGLLGGPSPVVLIAGLVIGLSVSGLYELGKTTVLGKK